MTKIKLEHIAALRDFVNPQLFPYGKDWKNQPILCVDGDEDIHKLLETQYPEAEIRGIKGSELQGEQDAVESADNSNYIVALGIKNGAEGVRRILGELIKRLNPGGVMAAAVQGYAGYHGLEMLSKIVKNYSRDRETADETTGKTIKAVLAQLPENHPARLQKAFIERLERNENAAIEVLQNINSDDIFTVSQLLEVIEESGGRMKDWIFPKAYDPARYMQDSETRETLEALPEPHRWKVAELVNARPSEHYIFIGKKEDVSFKIPWDSGDLYQWRPKRLPLYRWDELPEPGDTERTITPIIETEEYGFEPIKLESWQIRFCRASDGIATLNQILANSGVPQAQVTSFLRSSVENRLLALQPPG